MIDDSDEEMQDAMATTLSKGKDRSCTLAVTWPEQFHPNHVVEMPRRLEENASDGLLRDINVQPISKASANVAKDQC